MVVQRILNNFNCCCSFIITVMLFVYFNLFCRDTKSIQNAQKQGKKVYNCSKSIKNSLKNGRTPEKQLKNEFRHFIELNFAHTDNKSVMRQQL